VTRDTETGRAPIAEAIGYAYLKTIQPPPALKDIPLLARYTRATSSHLR
jgi:hypothetical protein